MKHGSQMLRRLIVALCSAALICSASAQTYTNPQYVSTWDNHGNLNPPTWFDRAFCNTAGYVIARLVGAWACAQSIPINLTWLGADPTGGVDVGPLVNSRAGASGRKMVLDPGVYNLATRIDLGNGTASSGSTINNLYLMGSTPPKTPAIFGSFPTQTAGVTLKWSGGAQPMVSVNGPVQNWGLSDLNLDCNGAATIGLLVTSAQFGNSKRVNVSGCSTAGVKSATVGSFGSFTDATTRNSFLDSYDDFIVSVPDITDAKGVWLTGTWNGGVGIADTCYNTWRNLTTSQVASSSVNYGLYLDAADGNYFYHYKPIINNSNNKTIAFDYTITPYWPGGTMFFGLEPGNPINIGTPTGLSRPNVFYGVTESNGNVYPTNLQNTLSAVPSVIGGVIDLSGQTAALSLRNATITPFKTGMYRVSYYLGTTTVGTAGNISVQWQWNDSATVQDRVGANVSATSLGHTEDSFVVFLEGGSDLNYQTNMVGTTGSPAYQLHARIERMD